MVTTPSSEGREGVWSKRPFTGSNYQLLWFEDTSENTFMDNKYVHRVEADTAHITAGT